MMSTTRYSAVIPPGLLGNSADVTPDLLGKNPGIRSIRRVVVLHGGFFATIKQDRGFPQLANDVTRSS